MNTYNQGDLFILTLISLEKLDGELTGHQAVIRIDNLAIEPAVFSSVLDEVFVEDVREVKGDKFFVTLQIGADHLTDGWSDFTDTEKFLEGYARRILGGLQKTPGWGSRHSADMSLPFDLLD